MLHSGAIGASKSRIEAAHLLNAITPQQFGAKGDGIRDDTDSIQAAIDAQAYGVRVGTILLPSGRYRITRPLHAGYGDAFRCVRLRGVGYGYRGESGFGGSVLIADFSDGPAINFQGARGSYIRGISFVGKNFDWVGDNKLCALDGADIDDTDGANWVDPTLHANADSRYAPYAAITVDGFSGTAPTTAYDGTYGRLSSFDVLIEDCFISGFVAGIVNKPSDHDDNGDFTVVRRVGVERCKYGISVGNNQSRNFGIENVKMTDVFVGLTNNTHGRQNGKIHSTVINLSLAGCINILKLGTTSKAGPIVFSTLFGERIWRIGDIDPATSVERAIIFQGAQINFTAQNDARGVPATVLGTGNQPIPLKFDGSYLTGYTSVIGIAFPARDIEMTGGTVMDPNGSKSGDYEKEAHNAVRGGLVLHQVGKSTDRAPRRLKYKPYANGSLGASVFAGDNELTVNHFGKSALASSTLVGKTLTITFASRSDQTFTDEGPLPGDILWDDQTKTVAYVATRDGLVVTAVLQNNYRSDGAGEFEPVTPISLDTGNWYIGNGRA